MPAANDPVLIPARIALDPSNVTVVQELTPSIDNKMLFFIVKFVEDVLVKWLAAD